MAMKQRPAIDLIAPGDCRHACCPSMLATSASLLPAACHRHCPSRAEQLRDAFFQLGPALGKHGLAPIRATLVIDSCDKIIHSNLPFACYHPRVPHRQAVPHSRNCPRGRWCACSAGMCRLLAIRTREHAVDAVLACNLPSLTESESDSCEKATAGKHAAAGDYIWTRLCSHVQHPDSCCGQVIRACD